MADPNDGNRIAFIDGENLVMRYQAMLAEGRTPQDGVQHDPDVCVWRSGRPLNLFDWINRASFYTSVVGDDELLDQKTDEIQTHYASGHAGYSVRLNARVFKKLKRSSKSRLVDIQITLDTLRAAYHHDVDHIIFITGDGDFIPVIEEIMRHGKRVHVAALSSGLNPALRRIGDTFHDLDNYFFKPRPNQ